MLKFRQIALPSLRKVSNWQVCLFACIRPVIQSIPSNIQDRSDFRSNNAQAAHQIASDYSIRPTEWRGYQFKNMRFSGNFFGGVSFKDCRFENVIFEDVVFDRCKFLGGAFDGCEFNQVRLISLLLRDTLFNDVSGSNLTFLDCEAPGCALEKLVLIMNDESIISQSWANVNLSGMDFSGRKLNGVNFSGARLNDAIFDSAMMIGAQLVKTNLQRASFKNTNLIYAQFQKSEMQEAVFIDSLFSYASFADANLCGAIIKNNLDPSQMRFQNGVSFNRADLSHAEISNVYLLDTNLLHAHMESATCESVVMMNCNAYGLDCVDSQFWGVFIMGTQFNEAHFFNCQFHDFQMINCKFYNAFLDLSEWNKGRIQSTIFDGSRIRGCAFFSLLFDLTFYNSNLDSVSFKGSHLHYVNFRSARGGRLNLIHTKLVKLTFSPLISSLVVTQNAGLQQLFNAHYIRHLKIPAVWFSVLNILQDIELLHDGYSYKDSLAFLLKKGIDDGFFDVARPFHQVALLCEETSQILLFSDVMREVQSGQLLWHSDIHLLMCIYFCGKGLNQDNVELIFSCVMTLNGLGVSPITPKRLMQCQLIERPSIYF